MNEEAHPNGFADGIGAGSEQRPLDEHLKDINARSSGVEVKAAATGALNDGWPPADVRSALEALEVGARKINGAIPKPARPHAPASGGLSPDYFREQADGPVSIFAATKAGEFMPVLVCSPVKALYRASDSAGEGWALIVQITDERRVTHEVALPYAEIATEPSAAVARMAAAGLRTYAKPEIVLGAVRNAGPLKRAYVLKTPGHHTVGGAHVFVLPMEDGVIGETPPDDLVRWGGDRQFCRVKRDGTMAGWKANLAAPLDGMPIPMMAIGTMLASPAIPFLPPGAESNTVVHLFGDNSKGKTTSLQAGASAWGMGAKPDIEGTYLNTWKSTLNGMESMWIAARHIGSCVDEIKTVDPKAARSLAYDISGGRRKARMNADGTARKSEEWSLFPLSSGELKRDEIGNSDGRRRVPADGGGAVRFIDIPAHAAFSALDPQQNAKAFTEMLGAAACTNYGHAGPAFVEWLIANRSTAPQWLAWYQEIWQAAAAVVLPPAPSSQAARVASRLGSIACCAALAAAVLELPWSKPAPEFDRAINEAIGADSIAPPARAMLSAFAKVLEIWLGEHGGGAVSTEVGELIGEMRNLYASRNRQFYVLGESQSLVNPPDGDGGLYSPSPQLGWRIMKKEEVEEEVEGVAMKVKPLDYVDVLLDTFTDRQALNWSTTKRDLFIRALKAQGLLIHPAAQLQNTRWSRGSNHRIYRIKGEFFNAKN